MTYTWTDNAMQGGATCDVDKVNDNLMYLRYDNLSKLDGRVAYSVNSGLTSIAKESDTEVSFTGTPTVTFPNGNTYENLTLNNVTGINSDGTYVFVIEEDDISSGAVTPKAISSTITEQTSNASGGSDGDYNLNVQVRPLYPEKKTLGTWSECQFLKLGQAIKSSNSLGTPIAYAFNGKAYVESSSAVTTNNTYTYSHNLGIDEEFIISDGVFNNISGSGNNTKIPNASGGYKIGEGLYNGAFNVSHLIRPTQTTITLITGSNKLWAGSAANCHFSGADVHIYVRRTF